jgi:hypothetical protein
VNRSIFFIGGAQRCGTTYLYSIMDQHPQISMAKPAAPEPKFFLNPTEVEKGEDYYLQKYFPKMPKANALGEKSTSYIESRDAGLRINAMFPEAKIIFMLRNPVARAISNYFFSASNGLEKRSPREVFLENRSLNTAYSTSVSPFKYIERSMYQSYLEEYISIFGRSRIKIIVFEDMVSSDAFVSETFDFIGVDSSFKPTSLDEKVNANEDVFDVEPQITAMLREYFRPHNEKLEKFLGISLKHWDTSDL